MIENANITVYHNRKRHFAALKKMKHKISRKKFVGSGFMKTCDELDIVKLPLMFIEGVVCPMKLYVWNFWES